MTLFATDRGSQGAFDGPAGLVDAVFKSFVLQSHLSCPLGHSHSLAVISEKAVCSGIVLLLLAGGPAAILGRVMAVAINAVHGVFRRGSRTEFGKELLKRIKAKLDAASAVVMVAFAVRILAAFLGVVIRGVLRSRPAVLSFPVRGYRLNIQATARAGIAAAKVVQHRHPLRTAIAAAEKLALLAPRRENVRFNFLNNCESSVASATGNVYLSRHNDDFTTPNLRITRGLGVFSFR